jgi:hypothetical protein
MAATFIVDCGVQINRRHSRSTARDGPAFRSGVPCGSPLMMSPAARQRNVRLRT